MNIHEYSCKHLYKCGIFNFEKERCDILQLHYLFNSKKHVNSLTTAKVSDIMIKWSLLDPKFDA